MFKYKLINSSKKLDENDFKYLESNINLKLPLPLYKLYQLYNGGEIEGHRRIFIASDGFEYNIKTFLPIRYLRTEGGGLIEEFYDIFVIKKKLIPDYYIPFAIDGGGYPYCYNCQDDAVYICYLDDIEEAKGPMRYITSSLALFINGQVTEDEAYG